MKVMQAAVVGSFALLVGGLLWGTVAPRLSCEGVRVTAPPRAGGPGSTPAAGDVAVALSASGEAGRSDASSHAGKIRLAIVLPRPQFVGTPASHRSPNLEPPRGGKPRPAIEVPAGADQVLSRDCKVTSSDPEPIIGELAFISDGDKEHDAGTYVEIGPGTQWVQLDLGAGKDIYAVCVWHYHGEPRVYRDVVCQISSDPDFIDGVVTVFNNDHDNSSELGAGKAFEYIETCEGRPIAVNGVKGRYVRLFSKGNTSNEMNHYTEVEVYGRP